MKWQRKGYSIPIVVYALTLISFLLGITYISLSYYIHRTNKRVRVVRNWKKYYQVLDEVIEQIQNDTNIGEGATSPFSGWFADLPAELDGYKITYVVEDSKMDINHLNTNNFVQWGILDKEKKIPDFFTNKKEVEECLKDKEAHKDLFSIYMLPNVNTAVVDKIKKYLELEGIMEEDQVKALGEKISNWRRGKSFLLQEGLIIDETKYGQQLVTHFEDSDELRLYLDYKGRVNLNFVSEEVFRVAVKTCNDKANIPGLWKALQNKRESETTIEKLDTIFGNNYKVYEKMFSVESNLFWVQIEKDDLYLKVLLRKYVDFSENTQLKLLRMVTGEVEPPPSLDDATDDKE